MTDYAAAKTLLKKRFDELNARVAELDAQLQAPLPADFAEQAAATENDDVLAALDGAARQERAEIVSVLRRIELGSYGMCMSCGEPIAIKRLQAVPFAHECVDCASEPN